VPGQMPTKKSFIFFREKEAKKPFLRPRGLDLILARRYIKTDIQKMYVDFDDNDAG
jgi:hypothetical protein